MSDMGSRIGDINLSEVWMMSALVRLARIDGLEPMLDMTVTDAWTMLSEVLTDRQAKVFSLRFGMANGRSLNLEDTGKAMTPPVSPVRVRQIEATALGRLRHWFASGMAAIFVTSRKWSRERERGRDRSVSDASIT